MKRVITEELGDNLIYVINTKELSEVIQLLTELKLKHEPNYANLTLNCKVITCYGVSDCEICLEGTRLETDEEEKEREFAYKRNNEQVLAEKRRQLEQLKKELGE